MRESHQPTTNGDGEVVRSDLEQALMTTFCRMLDGSRLPPMTVMRLMAEALGGVYRQVARAHREQSCPCGWCPATEADVASLRSAIGSAAVSPAVVDLASLPVLGRA